MLGKRNAIWLLGGWLLMQPPTTLPTPTAKGVIDLDALSDDAQAPLEKWTQIRAFDTAEACEAFRDKYTIIGTPTPCATATYFYDPATRTIKPMTARCVPSEYIYPPAAKPSGTLW